MKMTDTQEFVKDQKDLLIKIKALALSEMKVLLLSKFKAVFEKFPNLKEFGIQCQPNYYDDEDTYFKVEKDEVWVNGFNGYYIRWDEFEDNDEERPENIKELQEIQKEIGEFLHDLNEELLELAYSKDSSYVLVVTKDNIIVGTFE